MSRENLSNAQLVTIAVARLGGYSQYVDREDIALHVNELAPGRFSWRKYPEYVDLDAVGVALRDAKKDKYGSLLVGDKANGWILSPKGVEWIDSLEMIEDKNFITETSYRRHSIHIEREAEQQRLKNSTAYKLYASGKADEITLRDFQQFAKINEYFQTKARQKRYAAVDNAVVNDGVLAHLWEYLKEKYAEEMK